MVVVPIVKPVSKPVLLPILAIVPALLLHIPSDTPSLSVVVDPIHTPVEPVIASGAVLTVTVVLTLQLPTLYVIAAVPALPPVTIPVPDPT